MRTLQYKVGLCILVSRLKNSVMGLTDDLAPDEKKIFLEGLINVIAMYSVAALQTLAGA